MRPQWDRQKWSGGRTRVCVDWANIAPVRPRYRGLSVKAHGPHVDSRNKPGASVVEAKIFIPSLNKRATIRRSVKDARMPVVTPADAQVMQVLEQVARHPEFVLSRRELIRYVIAEPGKRSEELSALLRLDELETLRSTLQKIANAAARDVEVAKKAVGKAVEELERALAIPKLAGAELLQAVNERRKILELAPLDRLEATTSIRDGLDTRGEDDAAPGRMAKGQAPKDLKAARDALVALTAEAVLSAVRVGEAEIDALAAEPTLTDATARETLLASALELFDQAHCPVCDTEWEPGRFREIVAEKREHLEAVLKLRRRAEARLAPVIERMEAAATALGAVAKYGPQFASPVSTDAIQEAGGTLAAGAAAITALVPLDHARAGLAIAKGPAETDMLLRPIEAAIVALPEPSARDAARDYLTIGQEKLERYRGARASLRGAEARATTATRVFELYGQAVTSALDAIYKAVEARFVALYRIINHDDESGFDAHLTPSLGKLGFDVDFYGRGFFPPGAYHSEGHQDGMGVCLYLALMDHLLGKGFTFAVLDDVLMSVDAGHRREVSRLLQAEFPHTQFVLTTHDEIWLRHMRNHGLIQAKNFAHFRKWDVQHGPAEWDDRDVWAEVDHDLGRGNVRGAAATLRHYLEHFGQETCHRLRAPVEFRDDAQFMLGDTLPNAVGSLGKTLKNGRAAATSWNQDSLATAIEEREKLFAAARTATKIDNWQVNAAVHFSGWADLKKEDFAPLVAAFRDLVNRFTCEGCGGLLYVSPERGEREALRCSCGTVNINLKRKPAG